MKDITQESMTKVMQYAPVWAASMAGRTKVFVTDTPTAYVTASGGRFKIEVNEKFKDDPFVLLHEIAHIFRNDIESMRRHPHMQDKINVAADCIINDGLAQAGVPVTPWLRENGCWGRDIYKRNCSNLSINSLLDVEIPSDAAGKASEPSKAGTDGNAKDEAESQQGAPGEDGSESESGGVGDNPADYIGLGGLQVFDDPKVLAHGVAGYVRRMLFPTGFKSRNMDTKMDWRRNRSSFAGRTDIVIPRMTRGEVGHTYRGPLINLVLDNSGSMNKKWVQTAAMIAQEISNARLDYDLWLTPSRRKSTNPKKTLDFLLGNQTVDIACKNKSHSKCPNTYPGLGDENLDKGKPRPSRRNEQNRAKLPGADELRALAFFETEDPIAWIYIGDYQSSLDYEFMLLPNFIHVPIAQHGRWYNDKVMKTLGLPIFPYEAVGT